MALQLSKSRITKILVSQLKEEREDYAEYQKLRIILFPFEGKTITPKAIEKVLPKGYKAQIGHNGPEIISPRLVVYRDNSTSNKKHYVCYNGNQAKDFKIEFFDSCDAPYNAGAKERIQKLERILASPEELSELCKVFVNLNKTFRQMQELTKQLDSRKFGSYNNPAYYDLLNAIDPHLSNILMKI